MRIREILQHQGFRRGGDRPGLLGRRPGRPAPEHNLGAVIVSTDGATMAGIVSERDVVRHLATDADVLSRPVADRDDRASCTPATPTTRSSR